MSLPSRIYQAAIEIQSFCNDRGWRSCIIGGLAVNRWGEPRGTQDVDLSLFMELGSEEAFLNELLEHFPSRIDDPLPFALDNRIVLLTASNGITIDAGICSFSFEERIFERSSEFEYLTGVVLRTCSAEDLIWLKAVANRGRDWSDIEGVAIVQRDAIDWTYIAEVLLSISDLFDSATALDHLAEIRRIAEEE